MKVSRGFVSLVSLALASAAGAAHAAPIAIYSSWVGDQEDSVPDGSYFEYCDFGVRNPGELQCAPNQGTLGAPTGSGSYPDNLNIRAPVGGIGSFDVDGDGKPEWFALENTGNGNLNVWSGDLVFPIPNLPPTNQSYLTFTPALSPLTGIAHVTNPVGFAVVDTDHDGTPELVVAHTPDGVQLLVDVLDIHGVPRTSLTLNVPGMTSVALQAPTTQFLGFTADDEDGDGFPELMVLHSSPVPNQADVSVFHLDGTPFHTAHLSPDPVAADAATRGTSFGPDGQTYVGGFAHTALDTTVKEWIVLTVDHHTDPFDRVPPAQRFSLYRYDQSGKQAQKSGADGNLAPAVTTNLAYPNFTRAVALGVTALATIDSTCDGIDDDHDGQIDEDFQNVSVPGPGRPESCGFCQTTCDSATHKIQYICPTTDFTCDGIDDDCDGQIDEDAKAQAEQLNGLDDNCNGAVDDSIGTRACAPGQTDWYCCPAGADLHFSVSAANDPNETQDELTAAASCLPTGVAPAGATCSLRGVIRVAEQLRSRDGVRSACRVVAELAPGDYRLGRAFANTYLTFGGGLLTLKGMGATADATIIEPADPSKNARLLWEGLGNFSTTVTTGEHPPELTIQNLTMRQGAVDEDFQRGGGAILSNTSLQGAVLSIQDSVFDRNSSNQEGGAVQFWTPGTLTILRSVFRNNTAPGALANARGGAVSAYGAVVDIEDSSFIGNFGKYGGAICLDNSGSTLVNDTISQNASAVSGGGVYASNGTLSMRFNTLYENALPSGEGQPRTGGALTTQGTGLTAYGNIMAGSSWFPGAGEGTSLDCSITNGTVTAGSNLIGVGGGDCAALGAGSALIGSASTPVKAQLDEVPGSGATDLCPAGVPAANLPSCTLLCSNDLTSATCVNMPRLVPASPAIGAFPTGASNTGADSTCPLNDERLDARPDAHCTLGSIEPSSAIQTLSNGNIQLSLRLPGPPAAYVEAFSRQNGVQTISGDIRSSQVANADGTYTYSRVIPGSSYHTGDKVDLRFYYYRSGQAAVFLPGPTGSTWYPAITYRQPTATPSASICKQTNGAMRFALTLSARQAYVEAFAQQNGVQTVAGAITSSGVVNADGTVTYSRVVPATSFHATDVIRARFYHYETRAPGTFQPGPTEQIFYPSVVYSSAPVCPN